LTSVLRLQRKVRELKQSLTPEPPQAFTVMTWEGCIDIGNYHIDQPKRDCAKCLDRDNCPNDVRQEFLREHPYENPDYAFRNRNSEA